MAILSLNDILRNQVLESLQGSESVLVKTVMDLTSFTKVGANIVSVPNVIGLAASDISSGTRATAGGMTSIADQLQLSNHKQIPEYISYANALDSIVDQKAHFLKIAPKIFAQQIEIAIATELATASANDFNSGVASSFTLDNIALAKKKLDAARVPKAGRYLAVNANTMEILAQFANFVQAQQSLSPEALRQGIVSVVKGFNVVQSEDVPDNKIHAYHESAVAFALHGSMEYVEQKEESFQQEFICLRGSFGAKALDNLSNLGKRKLTITLSV